MNQKTKPKTNGKAYKSKETRALGWAMGYYIFRVVGDDGGIASLANGVNGDNDCGVTVWGPLTAPVCLGL